MSDETMLMNRPPKRPECEHGRQGDCPECEKLRQQAREATKPLEDQYWKEQGRNGLDHLFVRAYLMGRGKTTQPRIS
jgi:hypothetical protein